ncbi:MAG TPA: HsdR family type I site-specific deoxyribonuclease [Patescibacteria group bacterium]
MKLTVKKDLYYFDVPTLVFCEDERENNFIFVLLDDEKLTYIGKKVNMEDSSLFLTGSKDLRTVYETSGSSYLIGAFKSSKTMEADVYRGVVTEEMLPAEGLIMTPPDKLFSNQLSKGIVKKIQEGSSQSKVGQIERTTQNRVVSLFKNALHYRCLGNWEERESNSNVEIEILEQYLSGSNKYSSVLIKKAIEKFSKAVANQSKTLYDVNKEVYSMLRYGVEVKLEVGANKKTVWLIDWEDPLKNDFAIAEEVTIKGIHDKRPDIVLYINGIAIGVLELKRSTVSVSEGIRQNLDNQKHIFIKPFFSTIQYVMAGNDIEGLRYGAIDPTTNKEKNFLKWREVSEKQNQNDNYLLEITKSLRALTANYNSPLDKNIIELLNKERLIEFLHDFIVFDRGIKKLSRPNQYFGVKAAQDFVQRKQGGIIWHTQGSGKSLTMVWLSKWIHQFNYNSRVLIITDRAELDEQIEKVYNGVAENIYRTKSGKDLIEKVNENAPNLICSLVHKFKGKEEADEDDYNAYLKDLRNALPQNFKAKGDFYVFVDECHRTQSGKLHEGMKALLPDAIFVGFTGTPLLRKDKQTSQQVFGPFIHTYKFDEAVADKVVLDLRYEARDVEQKLLSKEKIDEWFDLKTKGLTDFAKTELKQKWGTIKKVFSSKERLSKIVMDVMLDFEKKERLQNGRGNALLVSDSIYNACRYYQLFQEAGLKNCAIVTSFVPTYADIKGEETGEGYTEKLQRYEIYKKMLAEYFNEDPEKALKKVEQFESEVKEKFVKEPAQMKLLIVVNKLLTGFDAPSATYLYIDKRLKDHGLFQAVCRVNRLDGEDKDYGYIVDYMDLFDSLKTVYHDYTSGAFDAYIKEDVEGLLKDRLEKGKERLGEALEQIKALCEAVEPPKDTLAHIKYFCGSNTENPDELKDTEQRRVTLYKLTIALIRAYANVADEMDKAGYTQQQVERVKNDVNHFENLRKEIQIASGDYVDLKQYEPAMRHLIDAYIGAEESRVLSKFDDLSLVELLVTKGKDAVNDLPKNIRDDKDAMAETIENNLRRVIIEESPTNPMYYDKMSVLLDELIKLRKEQTIEYEQYLNDIVALTTEVKKPGNSVEYPASLDTAARRNLFDNTGKNEALAIALDNKILSVKKDRWRDTTIKRRKVEEAVKTVLKEYGITEEEEEVIRIIDLIKNQRDY